MKKVSLLVLALMSFAIFAKDKKPPEWRTGTLLDTSTERGTRVVGDKDGVMTLRNDQAYYQIDDGDKYIYVIRRSMTSRWDRAIPLTVNGPIKFALDGEDMLIIDEKGKQHRLAIEKKALKKPPP